MQWDVVLAFMFASAPIHIWTKAKVKVLVQEGHVSWIFEHASWLDELTETAAPRPVMITGVGERAGADAGGAARPATGNPAVNGVCVPEAAQQLRALADAAEATGYAFDTYGAGDGLNAFEAKVAAMLGKEAGLFVATGTMAQQSVLRAATWVHGLGSKPKVFVHGTSHLVHQDCLRDGADQAKKFARHAAVNLPDFDAAALGSFDRVIQLRDVVTAFYVPGAERNAAVVLELPQRMNGARPARRTRRPP